MDASQALGPVMFRFTDPQDVELYGDRWFRYDESEIIRMRARDLIALEVQMGTAMVNVMNGARVHSTLGDLGAAWLGVRAADPNLAGEFEKFNPVTLAITWANPDEVDEGKAPEPETDSALTTTSAPADTVTLPTLPIAE